MGAPDPLGSFLPAVQEWFRTTLGEPTAAQRLGWPAIAAGQHTLILAPTGSGKTLAAFLSCLDGLWRDPPNEAGVRVLYVSPLKALNNDIHRNLMVPLEGVAETARKRGEKLPAIRAAVRTGDTTQAERRRLLRQPPEVLITTPESLHLLLTSGARETLRGVSHCILDEIHSVCPNKRGVFLSILLERLAALTRRRFVRIGLSATQRPLDEVARYLGGSEPDDDGKLAPRRVTIIDAGLRKELDLQVISPVDQFGPQPERSIWPSIYRTLADQVRQHHSTLIFTNNRRSAERIASHLNDLLPATNDGTPVVRAHHGSIALKVRQETERALKEGRVAAVVATASLELGIDMGAVDLVCQVESAGSVARGLQRVGRAGHLVGQKSKGRLIPKTPADLVEEAALARAMLAGQVEELRVPTNCLDVLAQQIVAMTSIEEWEVDRLRSLVRQAYPYRDLSEAAFASVLEMVSGRYQWTDSDRASTGVASLRPRASWDRIHNRLAGLPGSRQLALLSGGTIPDTGQYGAYTTAGNRVGELDEEFVFERRVGESFLLGTSAWRLEKIERDRVIVAPVEGTPAMVPFWHGEQLGRTRDLGLAVGGLLRELVQRIDQPDCLAWVMETCRLDFPAANNMVGYVRRQLAVGAVPDDRTLLIEASRDPLGDWQVVVLSPFGARVHHALRMTLLARLRQRLGYAPQCLHHDEGVLIRLPSSQAPVLDLLDGITAENVKSLLLSELADSPLFALRFRQNAARALLLPRLRPGKRAPLWLQRLRGGELLDIARRYPDFPIVAETVRECLHDYLDLPSLTSLLARIAEGSVTVVSRQTSAPSPFASSLLFAYTGAFMYQDDRAASSSGSVAPLHDTLADDLPPSNTFDLDPRAIEQVDRRLQGTGPRSTHEAAEWLRRRGDVPIDQVAGSVRGLLEILEAEGRVRRLELPESRGRFILAEDEPLYRSAFAKVHEHDSSSLHDSQREAILRRYLHSHALVSLEDLLEYYPLSPSWTVNRLETWSHRGEVAVAGLGDQRLWALPVNLEQVRRSSLSLRRREVIPCPPERFADFVLRWQFVHPSTQLGAEHSITEVFTRLQGLPLPVPLWERFTLPARLTGFHSAQLEEWTESGAGAWIATSSDSGALACALVQREDLGRFAVPLRADTALSDQARKTLESLRRRGAAFLLDLARDTGLAPSDVTKALWDLAGHSLVSNDSFRVLKQPHDLRAEPPPAMTSMPFYPGLGPGRGRRRHSEKPAGRWWALPEYRLSEEERALFQARLLLERYGVVARGLAAMDPWMLPWRQLYGVLSRLEWAGYVRRGNFVEGLAGSQFALPRAAQMLDQLVSAPPGGPCVLLHSQDPANLYGAGAPLEANVQDSARTLQRRPGTWLVLQNGRPVIIAEQNGKRLTIPAGIPPATQALLALKGILRLPGGLRKLTIQEYNGQSATASANRAVLEAAGFVSDYRAMTYYPSLS